MSWELGFGLGALFLGLVLAYGLYQSTQATRAADARGEAAAHRLYDDPSESDVAPRGHAHKTVPPLVFVICGALLAWLVFAALMARDTDLVARDRPAHLAADEAAPAV